MADVGIRDGRIARVDADGIPEEAARRVLDVTGLFVAPGFVDHHAHIQSSIRDYPLAEKLLRQGITTVIATPIPSTSIWHHSG